MAKNPSLAGGENPGILNPVGFYQEHQGHCPLMKALLLK
jgi:hypothetical protein